MEFLGSSSGPLPNPSRNTVTNQPTPPRSCCECNPHGMSGLQLPTRAAWWHLRDRDLMIVSACSISSLPLWRQDWEEKSVKTQDIECRDHTVYMWPGHRRGGFLPASLNLWKMTALHVHSTKQDDSESPATRVSFPCALQDSGSSNAGWWRGLRKTRVPSHSPTLLPSCLSPALAEPILSLCYCP